MSLNIKQWIPPENGQSPPATKQLSPSQMAQPIQGGQTHQPAPLAPQTQNHGVVLPGFMPPVQQQGYQAPQSFPGFPQNFPQSFSPQEFPPQAFATQNFPPQNYAAQNFASQNYTPQSFAPPSFPAQDFPPPARNSYQQHSFQSQRFQPRAFHPDGYHSPEPRSETPHKSDSSIPQGISSSATSAPLKFSVYKGGASASDEAHSEAASSVVPEGEASGVTKSNANLGTQSASGAHGSDKSGARKTHVESAQDPTTAAAEAMTGLRRLKPNTHELKLVHEAKRVHKRSYQSLMNTPRLPPLKKRDGEALWREDIQYDFLHAIFSDKTPAFTNPLQENRKCSFADVYLDAMANSTKCSKILGEKLTHERSRGVKIAMVCLLVNWGRMNTTLNFFPEMRTVLRTYHPIPSLQTLNSQDYKQLQDAPRLKSILKGACEGSSEVHSLESLEKITTIPRTNAINLVFLMSNYSQDVELKLIPVSGSFNYSDLIMDVTKSSKSRARAFLWLVWAYLEAPTIGDNTNNPFGQKFPLPEALSPEDIDKENINTPAELVFGNQMTLQRISILGNPPEDAKQQSKSKDEKAAKQHPEASDSGAKLVKPLVLQRPKLRSAKDRRLLEEFNHVLSLKRKVYRQRRLKRMDAIGDTLKKINDVDALYDSDEDTAKAQTSVENIPRGVLSLGLGTKYADYGERCLASALALKRAARKVASRAK